MLKKEYLIYKLSEAAREACKIDNELFPMYNVKRGLRNEDGSGVLVGLTQVGNVVGYERLPEGGLKAIPGKLFYRGYDVEDLAHDSSRKNGSVLRKWLIYYFLVNSPIKRNYQPLKNC